MEMNDKEKEDLVEEMISQIGDNPSREGLKDTPKRIVKMWKEIFKGYDENQLPKVTTFNNGSDGIVYDEMICDEGDFYSHCEHHGLVFHGKYYFSFIPHPNGKLLGLSKVARVIDYFSSRLQIQERLVHEVVEYLWDTLRTEDNKPIAMGLCVVGEHLCKTMRGVKKKGKMTTTKLKGSFKDDNKSRTEFIDWVNTSRIIDKW